MDVSDRKYRVFRLAALGEKVHTHTQANHTSNNNNFYRFYIYSISVTKTSFYHLSPYLFYKVYWSGGNMFARFSAQSIVGLRALATNNTRKFAFDAITVRSLSTTTATNTTTVSIAKHPHSLVPHPLTEFAPAEDDRLFAIISIMGKQHKVTKVSCRIVIIFQHSHGTHFVTCFHNLILGWYGSCRLYGYRIWFRCQSECWSKLSFDFSDLSHWTIINITFSYS